jgi:hypothetical protein
MIDNEELSGQLFIKDSHAYMFDSNNTLNDNNVYGMYNTEEYQIMLNRDGTLSSYKAGIKLPESFVNDNIKEITFDKTGNDNVIVIRYDSSNIIAFNYVTGEELFRTGDAMNVSLFEYLSSSLSSNTYSLSSPSIEYKESKKFMSSINSPSDKISDILNKYSVSDNSTSNILDSEFISVYNNNTNK